MKKNLVVLCMLLMMTSCDIKVNHDVSSDSRYFDMISLLSSNQKFLTKSDYFDIAAEVSKINDGYRYYVIIDSPHVALYNVEVIAIENGVDYTTNMASNIGIFEETSYHLIPNQTNIEKGYVKGLSISGVSSSEDIDLKVLVLWRDKSLVNTYKEYFRFNLKYEGDN